ncbi:putative acyl-CoA dehydrogenase [Gordonia polyisoprenivorans NBRC 16320 = JCM 10675]|uniref:Acyl-CoA/acyl-ACP dehydrogenase n=1 Tax=Gordonia polyisoprenivorans TaxID=84595 RepID=A0A846WJ34_9ACTN|nr:acyl-CoA dehydrogenase family protein [Gordonia polyisoprenivorans]NKY01538.1 acyl-CoA/acyl-ACP dehydrogenase [Gordonia polyisoprenivorans]GAB23147.1 putative acyl-CoA dehydrogenase [Gordonia polyisoprenivorans NBRC 16320 = JCM 10675]
MDFAVDTEAIAVGDVAAEVLTRHDTVWESKFADTVGGFDTALWDEMTAAGLGHLALPESLGGDDLGILALTPLLRRLGESAAVVPAIGSLTSALVLRALDSRQRWAGTLAEGAWHAVALGELGSALTDAPATSLRDGRLNGVKTGVLHAEGSTVLLVGTDAGVVAVRTEAPGVALVRTPSSSGWGEYTVRFDDVSVDAADLLTADLAVLRDAYRIALCAYADGLIAGATRLTADHVSNRHQFDKPIALFQAVSQQLADVYVVGRSMNLATTAAAWRMSEDLDAQQDLAIGTYWMADELPPTLRTMIHLHGGLGVDVTYPLHRYFSIAKDLARLVGGPSARIDELAGLHTEETADVH